MRHEHVVVVRGRRDHREDLAVWGFMATATTWELVRGDTGLELGREDVLSRSSIVEDEVPGWGGVWARV